MVGDQAQSPSRPHPAPGQGPRPGPRGTGLHPRPGPEPPLDRTRIRPFPGADARAAAVPRGAEPPRGQRHLAGPPPGPRRPRRGRAAGRPRALFFVAPFLLLSPLQAVVFIVVSQALFGFYLGVSFLTNHVGMPMLAGTTSWASSAARWSPRATCPARPSPGSSSGDSTPRSSTICSPPCRGPTCAGPGAGPAVLRRAADQLRPAESWRACREVLVHLRRRNRSIDLGHRLIPSPNGSAVTPRSTSGQRHRAGPRPGLTGSDPDMVAVTTEAVPRGSRSKSGAGPQP